MADHPYSNEATQAERKAIVKNDSYFARQSHIVDDAGGRYAKLTPATITGATPSPQYPQLPESSPWSGGFDQNLEPVLGFSVEEMPAPAVSIPEEPTPALLHPLDVGSVEPVGITIGSTTIKRREW